MLMSMNVFQQTTKPNLLYSPSSSASASCHGRRRIPPHNPPLLVSFPATKMKFNPNPKSLHLVHGIQHSSCKPLLASTATMGLNPKSLNLVHGVRYSSCKPFPASPATVGFNPKSLHLVHGIQHSSCKPVLASTATMKFGQVLFALPRGNEESPPSDNEEEPKIQEHEEHSALISSDNVNERQSNKVSGGEVKKIEYEVREATTVEEFRGSALLKVEAGFAKDLSGCDVGRDTNELVEQELNAILMAYAGRNQVPFMCIIAVTNEGENMLDVIGTVDFYIEDTIITKNVDMDKKSRTSKQRIGQQVVTNEMMETFKNWVSHDVSTDEMIETLVERVELHGRISHVAVAERAQGQGVGTSMVKFVIKNAKGKGVSQLCVRPNRDDKRALEFYRKRGFTITAETSDALERENLCVCKLIL